MNPIVTLEIKDYGTIKVELMPETAPNTVRNFISLVSKGFYNDLTFHRIISGFMIQGGDPKGNGTGGPGYSIKGEFDANGFHNPLRHERGVISMARAMNPDSAGSQFFIMHKNYFSLDRQYAAFGKVIEGIEVVDRIAETPTFMDDSPLKPVVIANASVDTFGEVYEEPEKARS